MHCCHTPRSAWSGLFLGGWPLEKEIDRAQGVRYYIRVSGPEDRRQAIDGGQRTEDVCIAVIRLLSPVYLYVGVL